MAAKPRRYWHNPLGHPTPGCGECGRVESHHMDPCPPRVACQTCNDTGALWLGGSEYVCKDCTTPPGTG